MNAGFVAAALFAGNFVWQAFGDQMWSIAIERSFFQAVALLCVFITRND